MMNFCATTKRYLARSFLLEVFIWKAVVLELRYWKVFVVSFKTVKKIC